MENAMDDTMGLSYLIVLCGSLLDSWAIVNQACK